MAQNLPDEILEQHPNGNNPPNVQEISKELKELRTKQTRERRELEEKHNQLKRRLVAQLKEAKNELAEKHLLEEKVLLLEQEVEEQEQPQQQQRSVNQTPT